MNEPQEADVFSAADAKAKAEGLTGRRLFVVARDYHRGEPRQAEVMELPAPERMAVKKP